MLLTIASNFHDIFLNDGYGVSHNSYFNKGTYYLAVYL